MTVPVPERRVGLAYSGIVGGAPVQGIDWERGVSLMNWLVAHGRALVPCYRPDHPAILSTLTGQLSYPAWLEFSYPAIDWIAFAEVAQTEAVHPGGDSERPVTPAARRSSYALGGVAGTIQVAGPTTAGWRVSMVGAYEIPRVAVEQTLAAGGATGLETISGQPIKYPTAVEQMATQSQRTRHGRRVLWQRAKPFATRPIAIGGDLIDATGFGVRVTSSSFVDVTPPIPTLSRRLAVADAVSCRGRVYTFHDGTADGEVRFVSAAGSASVAATSPSGAWTSECNVQVRSERTSDAAGLPAAGLDFVRVQARRTFGTGEIVVCGEVLYEAYS